MTNEYAVPEKERFEFINLVLDIFVRVVFFIFHDGIINLQIPSRTDVKVTHPIIYHIGMNALSFPAKVDPLLTGVYQPFVDDIIQKVAPF